MAAFMGKDVKKLKTKGGGKVSIFPYPRFSIKNHDLSRKTLCGRILRTSAMCVASHDLIVKKKLLNRTFAVEVHVRARYA